MDRNRKCEQTERDGEREWKQQQKKIKREGGKEAERISIYFTEDVIMVAVVMLAVTTATEIVGSCAAVHAKNQQCDFVPGCQRMTDGDAQNQRKLTNYRLWSSDSTEMMIYLIFYSLINFIYTYKYVLILDLSTAACFKQGGTEAKKHQEHRGRLICFTCLSSSSSSCLLADHFRTVKLHSDTNCIRVWSVMRAVWLLVIILVHVYWYNFPD